MTDDKRAGRAPSGAPPESLGELTEDIERTREDLGETVEALIAKVDVTARAREKAAAVADRVTAKADQVKEKAGQVKEQAAARMGAAGIVAPEPVRAAAKKAAGQLRQRAVLLGMAACGAVLAGWLILRRRR